MTVCRSKLEMSFWRFHQANPEVYTLLASLARQWTGRHPARRLGIAALFERVRWEVAIKTVGSEFKLANAHRAFYARLLMHREQDFYDLFELRSQLEPFSYIEPAPEELT